MNKVTCWNRVVKQGTGIVLSFFAGLAPVEADVFSAAQDTYANGASPNANFGDSDFVRVRSFGPTFGFIEFDVSSLSGAGVDSATLILDVAQVKKAGMLDLHVVEGAWSESTLTFNTQPSLADPFASTPVATADVGGRISVDVTGIVQAWADGSLANFGFGFTSSSINVSLGSKEGLMPAQLDVTTSGVEPLATQVHVPRDFDTIQMAISAANSSAWCPTDASLCSVTVDPGSYDGFGCLSPPGRIAVVGAGAQATVVGPSSADGCEIRNLTIQGPGEGLSAFRVEESRDIVSLDNVVVTDGEIRVQFGSTLILSDVKAERVFIDVVGSVVANECEIGTVLVFDSNFISRGSRLGSVGTGESSDVGIFNSTATELAFGDTNADILGTQVFGTVFVSESTVRIGNSRVNGGIGLDPNSPIKCTNVLKEDFSLYQADCSP